MPSPTLAALIAAATRFFGVGGWPISNPEETLELGTELSNFRHY